jgi:hypothetical protein
MGAQPQRDGLEKLNDIVTNLRQIDGVKNNYPIVLGILISLHIVMWLTMRSFRVQRVWRTTLRVIQLLGWI